MARKRTITSIETEMKKVKAELKKAQDKCDKLSARFLELQEAHRKCEADRIIDAYLKSGKSLNETLTFLGAWICPKKGLV